MSGAARFGAATLTRLEAKIVPKLGIAQAQRIPLNLIDEDPSQPRRAFPEAELQQLAASICMVIDGVMVGVLQPVGVETAEGGRYLLRWGARRVRASRMARLTDIPAVLVGAGQQGLEAQVIENQHRASNTDSELAAAVATLTERGMKNAEIATVLALPDQQSLKHYRALTRLHETAPELTPWIDKAHVRALYELAGVWQKAAPEQRAALLGRLETAGEVTVTSARRLIDGVMAQPANEVAQVVEGVPGPTPPVSVQVSQKKSKAKTEPDVDAERLAVVWTWIDDPTRPRPPLSV